MSLIRALAHHISTSRKVAGVGLGSDNVI